MEDEKIKRIGEIQAELERMEKLRNERKISDEEFAEKSANLVFESINISQGMLAGMGQGAPNIAAEIPGMPVAAGAENKKKGADKKGETI